MQKIVLSTDGIPESDRFAHWRDGIARSYVGVSVERDEDDPSTFSGRSVASIGKSVVRIRNRAHGLRVSRRPSDVARVSHENEVFIYREVGACGKIDQSGREFFTSPGDLIVADPTVPYYAKPRHGFDHELWFFPRKLVEPHLPVSRCPRGLDLSAAGGLAAMIKSYLEALSAQLDGLDDREADVVADNFCRLLAVACGAAAGDQKDAIRRARLEEAKRHIDRHLSDPRLSSERAAAALKISVRQLHLLFESSGASFAQYVVMRRLEECRSALISPIGGRSVTDIAFAWGFNSLATFFRRFRDAYGMTPCEMRRQAVDRN